MLQSLSIHDVALIERLDMEFESGLNILTGETGAGKSIVIDAMNLVLGERGSRELIKYGAEKARVEAAFTDADDPRVAAILAENGIEGGELILSRELYAAGKNVCRINGTLVTLSLLKSVSDLLVDLHGQHAHQALLDPRTHIAFLDACASDIGPLREKTARAAEAYHALLREEKQGLMPRAERERQMDLLRYQIREIEAAELQEAEEETLAQERGLLLNAEKIMTALEESYALVNDEGGALERLGDARQALGGVAGYAAAYEAIHARLDEAYYALEDAAYALRDEKNGFAFDPQRLEEIESRLEAIADLKRKYGQGIPEILSFCAAAQEKLQALQDAEARRDELQSRLQECREAYLRAAEKLGAARKKTAARLEKQVVSQLAELGMEKSAFSVRLDVPAEPRIAENGEEDAEFMLSANPGEPLKPLAKVASGGELSRIMLAFKTILADRDAVPVLIFDEVDTGISGKTASVVGEKMVAIARNHQVICVTHLPQIAAFADVHFLVKKESTGKATSTDVGRLDADGCVRRLADMMGGGAESALGREHAQELLHACAQRKTALRGGQA